MKNKILKFSLVFIVLALVCTSAFFFAPAQKEYALEANTSYIITNNKTTFYQGDFIKYSAPSISSPTWQIRAGIKDATAQPGDWTTIDFDGEYGYSTQDKEIGTYTIALLSAGTVIEQVEITIKQVVFDMPKTTFVQTETITGYAGTAMPATTENIQLYIRPLYSELSSETLVAGLNLVKENNLISFDFETNAYSVGSYTLRIVVNGVGDEITITISAAIAEVVLDKEEFFVGEIEFEDDINTPEDERNIKLSTNLNTETIAVVWEYSTDGQNFEQYITAATLLLKGDYYIRAAINNVVFSAAKQIKVSDVVIYNNSDKVIFNLGEEINLSFGYNTIVQDAPYTVLWEITNSKNQKIQVTEPTLSTILQSNNQGKNLVKITITEQGREPVTSEFYIYVNVQINIVLQDEYNKGDLIQMQYSSNALPYSDAGFGIEYSVHYSTNNVEWLDYNQAEGLKTQDLIIEQGQINFRIVLDGIVTVYPSTQLYNDGYIIINNSEAAQDVLVGSVATQSISTNLNNQAYTVWQYAEVASSENWLNLSNGNIFTKSGNYLLRVVINGVISNQIEITAVDFKIETFGKTSYFITEKVLVEVLTNIEKPVTATYNIVGGQQLAASVTDKTISIDTTLLAKGTYNLNISFNSNIITHIFIITESVNIISVSSSTYYINQRFALNTEYTIVTDIAGANVVWQQSTDQLTWQALDDVTGTVGTYYIRALVNTLPTNTIVIEVKNATIVNRSQTTQFRVGQAIDLIALPEGSYTWQVNGVQTDITTFRFAEIGKVVISLHSGSTTMDTLVVYCNVSAEINFENSQINKGDILNLSGGQHLTVVGLDSYSEKWYFKSTDSSQVIEIVNGILNTKDLSTGQYQIIAEVDTNLQAVSNIHIVDNGYINITYKTQTAPLLLTVNKTQDPLLNFAVSSNLSNATTVWQISSNNGQTWQTITVPLDVSADTYKSGSYLIKVTVNEYFSKQITLELKVDINPVFTIGAQIVNVGNDAEKDFTLQDDIIFGVSGSNIHLLGEYSLDIYLNNVLIKNIANNLDAWIADNIGNYQVVLSAQGEKYYAGFTVDYMTIDTISIEPQNEEGDYSASYIWKNNIYVGLRNIELLGGGVLTPSNIYLVDANEVVTIELFSNGYLIYSKQVSITNIITSQRVVIDSKEFITPPSVGTYSIRASIGQAEHIIIFDIKYNSIDKDQVLVTSGSNIWHKTESAATSSPFTVVYRDVFNAVATFNQDADPNTKFFYKIINNLDGNHLVVGDIFQGGQTYLLEAYYLINGTTEIVVGYALFNCEYAQLEQQDVYITSNNQDNISVEKPVQGSLLTVTLTFNYTFGSEDPGESEIDLVFPTGQAPTGYQEHSFNLNNNTVTIVFNDIVAAGQYEFSLKVFNVVSANPFVVNIVNKAQPEGEVDAPNQAVEALVDFLIVAGVFAAASVGAYFAFKAFRKARKAKFGIEKDEIEKHTKKIEEKPEEYKD